MTFDFEINMKKKSQMQRFSPVQQIFSIRTQPPQNENVLYNIPPPFTPLCRLLTPLLTRFAGCQTNFYIVQYKPEFCK